MFFLLCVPPHPVLGSLTGPCAVGFARRNHYSTKGRPLGCGRALVLRVCALLASRAFRRRRRHMNTPSAGGSCSLARTSERPPARIPPPLSSSRPCRWRETPAAAPPAPLLPLSFSRFAADVGRRRLLPPPLCYRFVFPALAAGVARRRPFPQPPLLPLSFFHPCRRRGTPATVPRPPLRLFFFAAGHLRVALCPRAPPVLRGRRRCAVCATVPLPLRPPHLPDPRQICSRAAALPPLPP